MLKIYLVGSLANRTIIDLAVRLRDEKFEVFDEWIGPGEEADAKFNEYRKRRGLSYKESLKTPLARDIYEFDKKHIDLADIIILVMPAGKSGHLELGYASGKGKKTYVLFEKEPERIDIMYQFATDIFMNEEELLIELRRVQRVGEDSDMARKRPDYVEASRGGCGNSCNCQGCKKGPEGPGRPSIGAWRYTMLTTNSDSRYWI